MKNPFKRKVKVKVVVEHGNYEEFKKILEESIEFQKLHPVEIEVEFRED